jgi:transposase
MWSAGIKEIFVAQHAVDFRKGADALIAECYAMELDPYRGECVVFVHRSRRAVKVIGGDAHGVWVLLRRFEGGALGEMFPFLDDRSFVSATAGELAMLLEGATCEVKAKARPWRSGPQGDTRTQAVLPVRSHGKEVAREEADAFRGRGAAGGVREGQRLGERA